MFCRSDISIFFYRPQRGDNFVEVSAQFGEALEGRHF